MTSDVQSVTVSSEGPAAEMDPDSMGQYNILRDVYRYDRPVYKHVDREDRFIIYADDTWYITRDLFDEKGKIRSGKKEEVLLPEIGWEIYDQSYYDQNFDNCKTTRLL